MFRLSGTTTVGCDAAALSSFLADVGNEPKWQKDILHVQRVEGEGGTPGAKYERVQVVGGRNIKTINELTEHVPGQRVVFQAKGKVIEYTLQFTLEPRGSGTNVAMSIEAEMLGFASMFESIAADELRAAVPQNLERLQGLFPRT